MLSPWLYSMSSTSKVLQPFHDASLFELSVTFLGFRSKTMKATLWFILVAEKSSNYPRLFSHLNLLALKNSYRIFSIINSLVIVVSLWFMIWLFCAVSYQKDQGGRQNIRLESQNTKNIKINILPQNTSESWSHFWKIFDIFLFKRVYDWKKFCYFYWTG